jgi:hypothetical protein
MSRSTIRTLSLICCVLAFSLGIPTAESQTSRTFTTINAPGAIHTEAYDVDGFGDIVGFYVDSKNLRYAVHRIMPVMRSASL